MNPSREQIETAIRAAAEAYGLDAEILIRQCAAESSFRQDAVSPCGAIGLFQLMPATAAEMGQDPHDWRSNVLGGARYMRWLSEHYERDYAKMLAAYNWGLGRLDKLLRAHPDDWREHLPAETAAYLRKILTF